MVELISLLITRWPTRKNRLIGRRLRLLKETGIYNDWMVRYGPVVLQSPEFREFIYLWEVETILNDPEQMTLFFQELDQYVKWRNL